MYTYKVIKKKKFKFDRFYIIIEFSVSYCKKFYDFFSLYCPSRLYKKKKKKNLRSPSSAIPLFCHPVYPGID